MTEDVSQPLNDAPSTTDPIEVTDHRAAGAFELRDAGKLIGIAQYAVVPASEGHAERVVFFHTEVSKAYEGQGLAGRLASAALQQTVDAGRVIVPVCPFITAYLKRHPDDYAGHVHQPQPADLEAVDHAVDG